MGETGPFCWAGVASRVARAASTIRPIYSNEEAEVGKTGDVELGEVLEGNDTEADDEEHRARTPKVARRPITPTKADLDEHLPLHAEYRDWCEHCVAGKGEAAQHRQHMGEKDELGPTIDVDYAFMKPEDTDEDMCPVVVAYDGPQYGMWVMETDQKGPTDASVTFLNGKLEESGYDGVKITMKSDQEDSIKSLKKAVAVRRRAETAMIESPVRDSKSNGRVERAIKTWQSQFRTLRHFLESRLGEKCPKDCPLTSWLATYAAEVRNRYTVQKNGRTNYEMVTSHRCNQQVCGFGEKVMFRVTPEKTGHNKLDTDWSTGYFVGVIGRTTEYLISCGGKIIACRTLRRLPDEKAYDRAMIEEVTVRYRDYVCSGAKTSLEVRHGGGPMPVNPDPNPLRAPIVPRRARITPRDLAQHGYTVGCPGCEYVQSGVGPRRGHDEDCRVRLEEAMVESEEGGDKLKRAKDRFDHWTAKAGEAPENEDVEVAIVEDLDDKEHVKSEGILKDWQEGDWEELIGNTDDAAMEEAMLELATNEDLEDGPSGKIDVRIGSPVRQPAIKRNDDQVDDDRKARRKMGSPVRTPAMKRQGEIAGDSDDGKVRKTLLGPDQDMSPGHADDAMSMLSPSDKHIVASMILGVDITEMFSPERVVQVAKKMGLSPGSSMDLTTGWDFTKEEHRRKAWNRVRSEDPELIIGSPPCTFFSMLQELCKAVYGNKPGWLAKFERGKAEAIEHVNFCCSLYEYQLRRGKHFLHEHPWSAKSWILSRVVRLLENPAVTLVQAHMCRFGMETVDDKISGSVGLVKKPTGFMTSSPCIAAELEKQCDGSHKHIHLVGGRAAAAAIYPEALCQAICRGFIRQKKQDASRQVATGRMDKSQVKSLLQHISSCNAVPSRGASSLLSLVERDGRSRPIGDYPSHWVDDMHQLDGGSERFGVRPQDGVEVLAKEMDALNREMHALSCKHGIEKASDDVTNQRLEPQLVKDARKLEMEYFERLGVYEKVERAHQQKTGGQIIGTRWVDVNKGDSEDPNYRSRLVGREFNTGVNNALYAATPPLEALRLVVSYAATDVPGGKRRQVMVNDVRRAYFYAKATRDVYIELPQEDPDFGSGNICKLRLCLYGTRDAAKGWQAIVSKRARC